MRNSLSLKILTLYVSLKSKKIEQKIDCEVNEGDMLFVPTRWWHDVDSVGEINIAINFWYNPEMNPSFK